jgi:hypothetical protein
LRYRMIQEKILVLLEVIISVIVGEEWGRRTFVWTYIEF